MRSPSQISVRYGSSLTRNCLLAEGTTDSTIVCQTEPGSLQYISLILLARCLLMLHCVVSLGSVGLGTGFVFNVTVGLYSAAQWTRGFDVYK